MTRQMKGVCFIVGVLFYIFIVQYRPGCGIAAAPRE
jgi:hypothetical protein